MIKLALLYCSALLVNVEGERSEDERGSGERGEDGGEVHGAKSVRENGSRRTYIFCEYIIWF